MSRVCGMVIQIGVAIVFILIDSEMRTPVPLPFHTKATDETSVTIHDFNDSQVLCDYNGAYLWVRPKVFGLELISEADFMRERD
jgi:hypothetical protein